MTKETLNEALEVGMDYGDDGCQHYWCNNCGENLRYEHQPHCEKCGQKIKWQLSHYKIQIKKTHPY